ncbi:hypothetical protein DEFR109230_17840 [Deinococcus frigens]
MLKLTVGPWIATQKLPSKALVRGLCCLNRTGVG